MASLLIAAHGERGGAGEDQLIHDLVARLSADERFAGVAAGFIRSRPTLAEARAALPDGPVAVYPLFMSAGYYVATAIPRELGIGPDGRDALKRPTTVMRPLGLNPGLPALVADLAAAGSPDPTTTTLLLVAHGSSKDGASRDAAMAVAHAVARGARFAGVETAFLEEPPFLDGVLRNVPGPAVVVGLFAGEGMHGGEDLPQAVAACGRDDVVLAEPLGRSAALLALVCEEFERADIVLSADAGAGLG